MTLNIYLLFILCLDAGVCIRCRMQLRVMIIETPFYCIFLRLRLLIIILEDFCGDEYKFSELRLCMQLVK